MNGHPAQADAAQAELTQSEPTQSGASCNQCPFRLHLCIYIHLYKPQLKNT